MSGFPMMAQVKSSAICLRLGVVLPLTTVSLLMSVSGGGCGLENPAYHRQAGAFCGGVA